MSEAPEGDRVKFNLLNPRKDLHIKLPRSLYAAFRSKAYARDITMQEALNEFAMLVCSDDCHAIRILDRLSAKKLQAEIDAVPKKSNNNLDMDDLDRDTLYTMIEDHKRS